MRPALELAAALQLGQMVDSSVATTRAFWRTKFFQASPAEAADPRPFAAVLQDRAARQEDRTK